MKPKNIKIICWIMTALFSLSMLMDGIAGVLRVEAGREAIAHLGYPEYLLTIVGAAKILGALTILQNIFRVIKEWAYAGFAITFIGAFVSRAFVGDGVALLIPPIFMLVVMFITYFLWKKAEQVKTV